VEKRRCLILRSLLLTLVVLTFGIDQGQAAPVLNPAVDLSKPNFTYSPPLRKFIDSLPGLGGGARPAGSALGASTLGQYIPMATPGVLPGFPNDDYYEIALVEYHEQLHRDLPPVTGTWPNQSGGTKLRGYVQLVQGTTNFVTPPHYLGPLIIATKDRPVRIKFTNLLPPTSAGGNLFLPVDTTIMGAGKGPMFADGSPCDPATQACASYTQNRAAIHLHGGLPPWISDGTAHQWFTPASEVGHTPYLKGASQQNVPDMWWDSVTGAYIPGCAGQSTCATPNATTDPGPGSATFYWPNQMSGRLMFYHDHALGITRLNVYAGEAAGYLLVDPAEETALATAGVPGTTADLPHLVPLIIQDKTFVPDPATLALTDPLWNTANWGGMGNLWFPHVYMPNQDPTDPTGANSLGRWDYGPWFWPIFPVASPYPPTISAVPEAFMDTPVINGNAYPYLEVNPTAYRFKILNASNDRMLNLHLYQADPAVTIGSAGLTEVKMVPANLQTACADPAVPNVPPGCVPFPLSWQVRTPGMIPDILDNRIGGVPDPTLRGPAMIQIGTEGGLLPGPVLLPNTPVGYEQNKRNIVVLNVLEKTLFMGPAERADVIIDFTPYAGKTIILYNDAPAPVPAGDPRYDFYTGNPDYSATNPDNNQGGAPSTLPGMGPNTRTIMQFRVAGTDPTPGTPGPVDYYDPALLTSLTAQLPAIFKATNDPPIVPESAYNAIGYTGGSTSDTYAAISDHYLTFTPYGSTVPAKMLLYNKAIQELFDDQGRMNATLGVEVPFTGALNQTTIPLGYIDPTTETLASGQTQLWKITHNGVDSHPIHFHLVNVQVINRVGWDGAIRPPDPNEMGWKETVRMNPLEDIIVAMRAKVPTYPFAVSDSLRPHAPALPVFPAAGSSFPSFDPLTGQGITVDNATTNFGHEYTWHCHILGHEENDMMRPLVLKVPTIVPAAIANLTATATPPGPVDLTWTYVTGDEIGFRLERCINLGCGATPANFTPLVTVNLNPTFYTDATVVPGTTYEYRIFVFNTVGDSLTSNIASVAVPTVTAPLAPTNLTATASLLSSNPPTVALVWTDNSNNEMGFLVERATNAGFTAGFTAFPITAANVKNFTDTTVAATTSYYYRVRAHNLGGDSTNANAVPFPVTTPGQLSAAPTNLSATPVGPPLQVNLAWTDNANNETGFRIERAVGAGAFAALTTTLPNVTAYVDATVTQGTAYSYRVFAVNGSGDSAPSNTVVIGIPAAPSNLVASPSALNTTPPTMSLTWNDNSNNESNFRIERATNPGFTMGLTTFTVAANVTTFIDTTVTSITQYFYRVIALNALGDSLPSNTATATTPALMLPPPINLVATASAPGAVPMSVSLTWTDTPNETSFTIQRATDAGFTAGLTAFTVGANVTTFTDKTVAPTTTYFYRVIAFNILGDSPPSNTATVTTAIGPIYFPLIFRN
jgi:FtsP/CotA-like multicopper oxidase with cupredoxin domain